VERDVYGRRASKSYLATVRFWFTWLDRSTSLKAAFFRLATLRYAARRARGIACAPQKRLS
jgi:hypothetical protein